MERLMNDDAVDAGIGDRQLEKVALQQVDRHRLPLQLGARDAQHFGAAVERGDPARGRREDFGHPPRPGADVEQVPEPARSEEHTSELQSLMRISYAVFCLKKKTTN